MKIISAGESPLAERRNKSVNYNEFMKNVEEFVFAESQPEKADIIFVPGKWFPGYGRKSSFFI